MSSIKVDPKKLLEAGGHFGHKTSRWHPAMRPYIHSKRGNNHIIDLTKTAPLLEEALDAIQQTVAKGKTVLLVSTKQQAIDAVQEVAEATGMPYVVNRWLGGMLTNAKTMNSRIKYLKDLENRMLSGELEAKYSKLEVQHYQEEIDSMNHLYGGIKNMSGKPSLVFVVDVLKDEIVVKEAQKLGIKVAGLADTNTDPREIDYPIPCNDDALKAIKVVLDYVQQAIQAGLAERKTKKVDQVKKEQGAK